LDEDSLCRPDGDVTMRKPPKPFLDFKKKYPKIVEAYEHLASECHEAGPLSDRERILVKLGLAMGARMEGSLHSHVRKGLDAGLSPDQIRHAVLLALTTVGFSNMMAALTWANDLLKSPSKKK